MELDKVIIDINESVDLAQMVCIAEEGELLKDGKKSKIFTVLTSRLSEGRTHIKNAGVKKTFLSLILSTLIASATVMVGILVIEKRSKKKKDNNNLYESVEDYMSLEEEFLGKNDNASLDYETHKYNKPKRMSKKKKDPEPKEIVVEDKPSKSKVSGRVGMFGLMIAGIGLVAAYSRACNKKGMSVSASVKGNLNKLKNIFKSAKSKDTENSDKYDDLIDRIDEAVRAIDKDGKISEVTVTIDD